MDFDEKAFLDLLRLLQEKPELREALRQVLLSGELLNLPAQFQELAESHLRLEAKVQQLVELVGTLIDAQNRTELQVSQLVEAQARTEQRVAELAEAQARTERRVEELAEAQARTEQRVEKLEERVAELTEAQARTEQRVAELAEAQARTEQRVVELAEAQARTEQRVQELTEAQIRIEQRVGRLEERMDRVEERLERVEERLEKVEVRLEKVEVRLDKLEKNQQQMMNDIADLKGERLERRYREYAHAYFSSLLKRIRVIRRDQLASMLDDAEEQGIISAQERLEVLWSDLVVRGRAGDEEQYLLAEVSSVIDVRDVERAIARAQILQKVVQKPVIAVVAGNKITRKAKATATRQGVPWFLDGMFGSTA